MQNSYVGETSGLHDSNIPYRLFVVPALIPLSSLCSGVSAFPVPVPPPFCFLGRTSFLCPMRFVPPYVCSLFSFCVFFSPGAPVFLTPVPSTLCRFVALPSFASVRSVSLVRLPCLPCVCPLFRRVLPSCSFPLYLSVAFSSSSSFVPTFSFPFSPFLLSPSFSI